MLDAYYFICRHINRCSTNITPCWTHEERYSGWKPSNYAIRFSISTTRHCCSGIQINLKNIKYIIKLYHINMYFIFRFGILFFNIWTL